MILNTEALVRAELQHRLEIATKAQEAPARQSVCSHPVRTSWRPHFGRRHATA